MLADVCWASLPSRHWCLRVCLDSKKSRGKQAGLLPGRVASGATISDLPVSHPPPTHNEAAEICQPINLHSQLSHVDSSTHSPVLLTYSYTQHPKSSPYSFPVCPLLVFTPICTNHETQVVRVWKTNTPVPVSGSCSTTSSPSASHCVYAGRELKEVNCSFSSPSTGHTLHSVSVLSHHTTWQYSGRRDET